MEAVVRRPVGVALSCLSLAAAIHAGWRAWDARDEVLAVVAVALLGGAAHLFERATG